MLRSVSTIISAAKTQWSCLLTSKEASVLMAELVVGVDMPGKGMVVEVKCYPCRDWYRKGLNGRP